MSTALARERVLLVDDEPQVLVALEDLLSEEFTVIKADSAESALNVAEREHELAVVLTDQRMPHMNGDEFLRELEGRSSAARILVTGFADLAAVIRAVNDGRIFAYVSKPWQADDLKLKVTRAAEHFRLAQELAHERQLLDDLMDNIPDGIYFKDRDLRFQRANRAFGEILDCPPSSVVSRRIVEIVEGKEDGETIEREERRIVEEGKPLLDSLRAMRRGDTEHWFSESKAPIRDSEGAIIGLVAIVRDVTRRKLEEERAARLNKVRAFRSRVDAAIQQARDEDTLIQETCRAAVEFADLQAAALVRVDHANQAVHLHAFAPHASALMTEIARKVESRASASAALADVIETQRPLVIADLEATPGHEFYDEFMRHDVRSSATFPIFSPAGSSRVLGLFSAQPGFFENEELKLFTEAADAVSFALDHIVKSKRLDFLAYHDELTGLPNRELLLDRIGQQLASCRHEGKKLAMLLIDIGRFRQVNETLGRRGGDELLVQLARRLQAIAGDTGTAARFDGNVFGLVVSSAEIDSFVALLLENEILGTLRESFVIDGTELRVSARIGIALFPSDGDAAETLVANADAALKKAKASGQPYLFYAPAMNARVAEQMALETKLRHAVERQEFILHYQPKVDLKTGAVVGLEALIRWRDPESGLVPPGQFIPMLEETGLIREVGRWVLERAALQYHDWIDAGIKPPRIAVNVSALQLAAPDFVAQMDRVLQHYPLGGAGIDLEITESVFVDDLAGSIQKLGAARAHGMSVAIDDFGTGYSSLSYLARLPIDALKIDRSFVISMAEDPQSTSIVTTIISLAHALDLKVVAEGVETRQQAQLLRLLKCDELQGYLISKPLPADEVRTLIGKRFSPSERPKL